MNEEQFRFWTPIIISGIVSIVTGFWAIVSQLRLDKLKSEHQVKFSKLHENRLLVIESFIKRINFISNQFLHFPTLVEGYNDVDIHEARTKLMKSISSTILFFRNNRYYFDEQIEENVEVILSYLGTVGTDYEENETWSFPYETGEIIKALNPLINELENEFRDLLGVKRRTSVKKRVVSIGGREFRFRKP